MPALRPASTMFAFESRLAPPGWVERDAQRLG
jgi:hypothetical protein